MTHAALVTLFALVATIAAGESDQAFDSAFKKNLTTAAQGQINGFNTAQALIQGNLTQQFNNNNGGQGDNNVDQTSLTLDPSQIQVGSFQTGLFLPGSEAGEVASLTSQNNFINFCATQQLPLTNGLQFRNTGSCNAIPMGAIPDANHIPTTTVFNPVDGATLKSQSPINFQLRTTNMDVANFVNAQTQYYAAPQQLGQSGNIVGHTHITVSQINGLQDQTNIDATNFAFFLGVNTPTFNGLLTGTTSVGLPAGTYRLCSLTAAANHQPILVSIAQRVGQDDCVRFTVADDGDASANLGDQDAANQNANFVAQAAATFAQQSAQVAQSAGNGSSGDGHGDDTGTDSSSSGDDSNGAASSSSDGTASTAAVQKNAAKTNKESSQHTAAANKQTGKEDSHGMQHKSGTEKVKDTQKTQDAKKTMAHKTTAAKRQARREERRSRQARGGQSP